MRVCGGVVCGFMRVLRGVVRRLRRELGGMLAQMHCRSKGCAEGHAGQSFRLACAGGQDGADLQ